MKLSNGRKINTTVELTMTTKDSYEMVLSDFVTTAMRNTLGDVDMEKLSPQVVERAREMFKSLQGDKRILSYSDVEAAPFSSLPSGDQQTVLEARSVLRSSWAYGKPLDEVRHLLDADWAKGPLKEWIYGLAWDAPDEEKHELRLRCSYQIEPGRWGYDHEAYCDRLPLLPGAFRRLVDPGDPKSRVIIRAKIALPLPINYIRADLEIGEGDDDSTIRTESDGPSGNQQGS